MTLFVYFPWNFQSLPNEKTLKISCAPLCMKFHANKNYREEKTMGEDKNQLESV